jgi:hypothetical protein
MSEFQSDKRGPEVRIHINRQPYHSPDPTTGEALYSLGGIGPHQEMFRELGGDREDQPVPRSAHEIRLKEDEHFYSERDYDIIVNARKKIVTQRKLSFDEVINLAFDPPPSGPNVLFTVTYRNGPKENPQGTLTKGHSVSIKDGMVFNVTATDKS